MERTLRILPSLLAAVAVLGCEDLFPDDAPSIEVAAPTQGQVFAVGSTVGAAWASSGVDEVCVELSRDGGETWETVAAAVSASNGLCLWEVTGPASTECVVRVSDAEDGDPSDTSGTFEISAAAPGGPAVMSQPADATVTVGQTATFTVVATGTGTLAYQWQKTGAAIPDANSASYTTPPAALADDGAVFACVVTDDVDSVTSAGAVLTVVPAGTPMLDITSPDGGESWSVGETRDITWTSQGVPGTIDIHYSIDGGGNWAEIALGEDNDGTYAWAIPMATSTRCLVRLTAMNGSLVEVSDAVFSLNETGFTWYADASAPAGGDGLSWDTAFNHPQAAVDAASTGHTVRVAGGTYSGSGTSPVLTMKAGVYVYGGYAGYGEADPDARDVDLHQTRLDGNGTSYHVVIAAADARLDGFSVEDGAADDEPGSGGGMRGQDCPGLVVANCRFRYNVGGVGGGAIVLMNSASVRVEDCYFSDNRTTYEMMGEGGAVKVDGGSAVFLRCEFVGNWSRGYGGGAVAAVSSAVCDFEDCWFEANRCDDFGGALSGAGTVSRCAFVGNESTEHGGAIYDAYHVVDCVFVGNSLSSDQPDEAGGAIYHINYLMGVERCLFIANTAKNGGAIAGCATIQNSVFIGNSASVQGGCLMNAGWQEVANCTFWANSAGVAGGVAATDGTTAFTNCILWGNTAPSWPLFYTESGTIAEHFTATYSDVEGGFVGEGNIALDPAFVDSTGPDGVAGTEDDDLHLDDGSPCIDTGDPVTALTEDVDGDPRPAGSGYDMGAYER